MHRSTFLRSICGGVRIKSREVSHYNIQNQSTNYTKTHAHKKPMLTRQTFAVRQNRTAKV